MKSRPITEKLKSRKLWLSIVCVVSGIAMVFGVEGSEIERIVVTISGVITMLGGTALFNVPESKVDAASSVPIIIPAIEGENPKESQDDCL